MGVFDNILTNRNSQEPTQPVSEPEGVAKFMKELDNLIGLNGVKRELNKISNLTKAHQLGNEQSSLSNLTFVFEGNPGTGKTTVARLMGKILAGYGLISSPEVKEYSKAKLVSSVEGGSVKLVNEMFDNCIGRVLFIDEAYTLAEDDAKDVVDQIVANMTLPKYHGKMAIILAGYPDDMQKLNNVNAGMERRFKFRIPFDDYSNEELTQMYKNHVARKKLKLAEGCDSKILAWFKSQPRGKNFGNAGLIEKLHTEVEALSGIRLLNASPDQEADFYITLLPEDIPDIQPKAVDEKTENISPESTTDSMDAESVQDELLPDYTEQLDSLQGSLAEVKDVVENLQYNVSILVQNQASAADVAAMRRENEAFRSDSNMKLMRRYGIDAMIKTYQAICDKLFRINHPQPGTQSAEGEQKAFEWVLKRMERQFKQLGIRLQHSGTGCEFDGATMTVYGSEGEDVEEEETIFETNVESLKDTVKESVCPAFMWTIPSLIGDAKEWCMESEKVCIYK